jgi:hypothetical protein
MGRRQPAPAKVVSFARFRARQARRARRATPLFDTATPGADHRPLSTREVDHRLDMLRFLEATSQRQLG